MESGKWELSVLSRGVNTPKQGMNLKAIVHEQDCGREDTGLSPSSGSRGFGRPGSFKLFLPPLQGEARPGQRA